MSGEMSVNLMMVGVLMFTFSMYSYIVYFAGWGLWAIMGRGKPVKFLRGIDKANIYGWLITIAIIVYFYNTAT